MRLLRRLFGQGFHKPAASHLVRFDPDEQAAGTSGPDAHLDEHVGHVEDVDELGGPADHDAPAGICLGVDLVDLDDDRLAAAVARQYRGLVGAEPECAVGDGVVDRHQPDAVDGLPGDARDVGILQQAPAVVGHEGGDVVGAHGFTIAARG